MRDFIESMTKVETEDTAERLIGVVLDLMIVSERALAGEKGSDIAEAESVALSVASVLSIAIEVADRAGEGVFELARLRRGAGGGVAA